MEALRVSRRPHLRTKRTTDATDMATKPSCTYSETDETKSAANQAVLDYKVDQIEAQRAAVHSEHDICQPSDPCPNCLIPDPPRRRLLRPAQLRLQRPRLHIRRQGRGQGRLHSRNRPQEEARPPRRRRCPRPRRPGPQPPRQRSRPPRTVSCHRGGFETRLPWPSDAETRPKPCTTGHMGNI